MADIKYIGKTILNHDLILNKGNVSGSATSTGSFGRIDTVGKSHLGDDVRIADGKTLLLGTNGGNIEWLSEGGTRRGEIASLGDGIQFYAGQSPTEIFSLPASGDQLKMIGSADILWETDNSGDIGASGATRPRDLFVARNATIDGTITTGNHIQGAVTNAGGNLIYDAGTSGFRLRGASSGTEIFASHEGALKIKASSVSDGNYNLTLAAS